MYSLYLYIYHLCVFFNVDHIYFVLSVNGILKSCNNQFCFHAQNQITLFIYFSVFCLVALMFEFLVLVAVLFEKFGILFGCVGL